MTKEKLIGTWQRVVDRTAKFVLREDGVAVEAFDGGRREGTWKHIDESHWVYRVVIPPDPSTHGLEDGANESTEYEILHEDEKTMVIQAFDEDAFTYRKIE